MKSVGKKIFWLGGSMGALYTGYISWLQYGDSAKDWLVHGTLGFPIRINQANRTKKLLRLNHFNNMDKIVDKDLLALVKDLNQLTHAINLNDFEIKDDLVQLEISKELERVHETLLQYNERYLKNIEENIQIGTKDRLNQLEEQFFKDTQEKDKELNVQYAENFDKLKKQLNSEYQDLLNQNLAANAKNFKQQFENELTLFSMQQTESFNQLIDEKLNAERNNKLANLSELDSRMGRFSDLFENLDEIMIKNYITKRLLSQICSIQEKFNRYQVNSINLKPDIESLKLTISLYPNGHKCEVNCDCQNRKSCKCDENMQGKDNKLMEAIITELENISAQDNILSNEQLVEKWNLLSTDFKTPSLLPVNAGFMGHLMSSLYSLFQITRTSADEELDLKYNKIQESLILFKLNAALDDALDLSIHSRRICDNWIKHARRRLEVTTLLDLLSHEIRSLS